MLNLVILALVVVILVMIVNKYKEGMTKAADSEKILRNYLASENYELTPSDGYFKKKIENYELTPSDGYFKKKIENYGDIEQSKKSKSVRMGRGLGGVPIGGQFKQTPYVDREQHEGFTAPGSLSRILSAESGSELHSGFNDSKIRRLGVNVMAPPF